MRPAPVACQRRAAAEKAGPAGNPRRDGTELDGGYQCKRKPHVSRRADIFPFFFPKKKHDLTFFFCAASACESPIHSQASAQVGSRKTRVCMHRSRTLRFYISNNRNSNFFQEKNVATRRCKTEKYGACFQATQVVGSGIASEKIKRRSLAKKEREIKTR